MSDTQFTAQPYPLWIAIVIGQPAPDADQPKLAVKVGRLVGWMHVSPSDGPLPESVHPVAMFADDATGGELPPQVVGAAGEVVFVAESRKEARGAADAFAKTGKAPARMGSKVVVMR